MQRLLKQSIGPDVTSADADPADLRRFWRILLAVVAPLPWLALAASNAVTPDDLGSSTEETFASIAADPGAARAALWLGLVFVLLVVPSGVAMMMAHRRTAPRLTLVVGGFVTYAFCSMLTNPNLNLIGFLTHEQGLDTATTTALASGLEEHPSRSSPSSRSSSPSPSGASARSAPLASPTRTPPHRGRHAACVACRVPAHEWSVRIEPRPRSLICPHRYRVLRCLNRVVADGRRRLRPPTSHSLTHSIRRDTSQQAGKPEPRARKYPTIG